MELLRTELVKGKPPVLQVIGEIDLSTVDDLRTAMEDAMAADPTVVVDMGGVTFIDAVGLRAVLALAATRNGVGPLNLVNAPRVTWLLDVVGLADLPSIVIRGEGE
jgi:anti-anti-sigma factor